MSVLAASGPFGRFPQPPYDIHRVRPTIPGTVVEPLELTGGAGDLELTHGEGVLELTAGGVSVAPLQYRPGNVEL